ncbi:hypothetical protein EMIT051CA3_90302 [Pseudomonas chlororaphis]
MRAAHAPVQARAGKASTQGRQGPHIDAQSGEKPFAGRAQAVLLGALLRLLQPAGVEQAVMQLHRQGAGHMVVAGTGELQAVRGAWAESWHGVAADHHQGFQGLGHALVGQAVVAMAALHMQAHQGQVLELAQVRAGGGGADIGDRRQLGAGARMAVHQCAEHLRPRRLGNGRGDLGYGVVVLLCIHISLPNESCPSQVADSSNTSPPRIRPHAMDPITAVTHADPYPYYASLRARSGLAFDPGLGMWLASSAAAPQRWPRCWPIPSAGYVPPTSRCPGA